MADDLTDAIAENAESPASADIDGQRVSQHSLPDQIAADRYRRANNVAGHPLTGIRFTRLVPPGA